MSLFRTVLALGLMASLAACAVVGATTSVAGTAVGATAGAAKATVKAVTPGD